MRAFADVIFSSRARPDLSGFGGLRLEQRLKLHLADHGFLEDAREAAHLCVKVVRPSRDQWRGL
jgi:hypothetical protein